jgi:hypothetical protein
MLRGIILCLCVPQLIVFAGGVRQQGFVISELDKLSLVKNRYIVAEAAA